jgi:hypothetical protein
LAITLTTLSGAVVIDQNTIVVASATGAASGTFVLVDQEVMQIQQGYVSGTTIPVLRGRESSATQNHATGAQVKFFLASDSTGMPPQQVAPVAITAPSRTRISYTTAGAITLPLPGNDADAILNGTTLLAMTLANPTTDMDGCTLRVLGNGKAAHTVTYTAGLGNVGGAADVITFKADQAQGIRLVACGGFWVTDGVIVAGAATIAGPGLA